ncbi:histone H4 transcription factor-like [Oratosquilla oratoria]
MRGKRKRNASETSTSSLWSESFVDSPASIEPPQSVMTASGIGSVPMSLPEQGQTQEEIVTDDPGVVNTQSVDREPEKTGTGTRRKIVKYSDRMKNVQLHCEWNMCHFIFNRMEPYHSHVQEHLEEEKEPNHNEGYMCYWRDCGFICTDQGEYRRHVLYHAFHAKIKSIGSLIFAESNIECLLDSQVRNLIPEIPENFVCVWGNCDMKFESTQEFYWHVQTQVSEEKPAADKFFYCRWQDCKYKHENLSKLQDHTRSHTQEKCTGCPNCGAVFATITKLRDHCLRQLPDELLPYRCSHCSRRFSIVRLLRDHVRTHVNHFKCPQCEMTCTSRVILNNHIRYRHLTARAFKCTMCTSRFKAMVDLQKHMVVHMDMKAYSCSFPGCTFSCRAISTLLRHTKKTHQGISKAPYACHICQTVTFSTGTTLTKHLKTKHNLHWPSGHSRFK